MLLNITIEKFRSYNQAQTLSLIASENNFNIFDERQKYAEKILAKLYDFNKMPDGLCQVHYNLDIVIEQQCYLSKPFERLEHLFSLYRQMSTIGGNK